MELSYQHILEWTQWGKSLNSSRSRHVKSFLASITPNPECSTSSCFARTDYPNVLLLLWYFKVNLCCHCCNSPSIISCCVVSCYFFFFCKMFVVLYCCCVSVTRFSALMSFQFMFLINYVLISLKDLFFLIYKNMFLKLCAVAKSWKCIWSSLNQLYYWKIIYLVTFHLYLIFGHSSILLNRNPLSN